MRKLIMMRGLPGSGKSTKAVEMLKTEHKAIRLNRDLMREMFHGGVWTPMNEKQIVYFERELAKMHLNDGGTVIIDDTNLDEKYHQSMWSNLAKEMNATFRVEDIRTDVEECVLRDEARGNAGGRRVGESIIRNLAMRYDYVNPGEIVVVDMDGTLSNCDHRRHFVRVAEGERKDWKGFFDGMSDDPIRQDVWEKVKPYYDNGAKIVIVSARPDNYRKKTEDWLAKFNIPYWTVIMRGSKDSRPDTEVKTEIYEKHLKGKKILKVFDDRPSVVRMWQSHGLEVEDCGNGEEF